VKLVDPEPRVAVTMTVWLDVTVPARAVKVPEELAAGTVTETGMVREELLSESATVIPPVGAALVRVTVQVLEALGPRLVGLQTSEVIVNDATRLIEAVREPPPRVAVTVVV